MMVSNIEYLGLGLLLLLTIYFLHRSIQSKVKSLDEKIPNTKKERRFIKRTLVTLQVVTAIMYVVGWFIVEDAEKNEILHMSGIVEGITPTLAYELQMMGHSRLDERTDAHDPQYLEMNVKLQHWIRLNPSIRDIYTLKKRPDGSKYVVLAPATDFDKNGIIDNQLEAAVPIGQAFQEQIPQLEKVFQDRSKMESYLTSDAWGLAIAGFSPVYNEQGKVDAVLAMEFDREEWMSHVRMTRIREIGILLFPFSMFVTAYWFVIHFRLERLQITFFANHDALTGLPNRQYFQHQLHAALEKASQEERRLAVMHIDLDRFKFINDTLGHGMGDLVVKAVSERIIQVVQDRGMVGRIGGDKFAILLPNVTDVQEMSEIAQNILTLLSQSYMIEQQELFITASIGISVYPLHAEDRYALIRSADAAMSRAKEQGRNNYQYYSDMINASTFEKLLLENNLRKAVENSEFEVFYQPQIQMETGEVIGAEALIRWHHPDMGIVSPAMFIPLAEETGLIIPIGEWVMRTACKQAKEWQSAGRSPICIAVNLSAIQFQHDNLVSIVQQILQETGLEPSLLELEITESIAMQNTDRVIEELVKLRNLGVKISMDDFGTGYSSLNNVKKFPINQLKLDKSFVRDIAVDPNDAAIAKSIIEMAHTLKLDVLAEGVENHRQLAFLKAQKCNYYQGYLFSPPLPSKEFEKILIPKKLLRS